jgi:hypothetical protein
MVVLFAEWKDLPTGCSLPGMSCFALKAVCGAALLISLGYRICIY